MPEKKSVYQVYKEHEGDDAKIQWKKLVMNGTVKQTPGGKTKKDIKTIRRNGNTYYVYKSRHELGKKRYNQMKRDKGKAWEKWQRNKQAVTQGQKPKRSYSGHRYKDYY